MSYIRLVNVTKRFGDVTAVDNLNIEIGKGECFSMLGPSGCGKTTTLRMVAGFEDLSDGEVCFPGGKYECEDNSFRNTAVRETCEELGLKPENITICGELDCLVTHNGPIIHSFVGLIDDISKITYSKSEVERIFTVPLKMLLEQKPRRGSVQLADHPGDDFPFDLVPQRKRGWRMNKSYYVYFYLYEDKVIWGLTARMLYAFLYRSRKELTEYLAEEID